MCLIFVIFDEYEIFLTMKISQITVYYIPCESVVVTTADVGGNLLCMTWLYQLL